MKKHIKLFEEYTEQQDGHPGFYETEEEIHKWLEKYDRNYSENTYTINKDGTVDVDGGVNIGYNKLNYILVEFNYVSGDFSCFNNDGLTSLEGAPQKVDGDFYCKHNDLTSLEGAPQKVDGWFDCSFNNLITLKGAPQKVDGFFVCGYNDLTSLEGAPQKVGGDFDCQNNDLITLENAPDEIHGDFDCKGNKDLVILDHKSKIKGKFYHDELQGTVEERILRYIDYLEALDMEEKRSSIDWLRDVDEEFHKSVVEYALNNDINLPGVDKNIASDALKHKDSGLF